jgi:hypothetical protein
LVPSKNTGNTRLNTGPVIKAIFHFMNGVELSDEGVDIVGGTPGILMFA